MVGLYQNGKSVGKKVKCFTFSANRGTGKLDRSKFGVRKGKQKRATLRLPRSRSYTESAGGSSDSEGVSGSDKRCSEADESKVQ